MVLNRGPNIWTILLVLLALNFLVVNVFFPGEPAPVEVPYTLFREQVTEGNVARVVTRSDILQGEFASPVELPAEEGAAGQGLFGQLGPVEVTSFSTVIPAFVDPGLVGADLRNLANEAALLA